jgi:hypothetical protein
VAGVDVTKGSGSVTPKHSRNRQIFNPNSKFPALPLVITGIFYILGRIVLCHVRITPWK